MADTVRFWGVRGSIATPGSSTVAVGGNTSCVEARLGGERLVLDGGTGLRALGAADRGEPLVAAMFFGHLHWDHIQGVPFLGGLFHPGSRVRMVGPRGLRAVLEGQMSRPSFPVSMDIMAARISIEELEPGDGLIVGDVKVSTAALNHPGGAIGYRLERQGRAVVYACDNEHREGGIDAQLLDLARGADVLVYDAQYLPEEYSSREGWGHSTYAKGAELAEAAGVGLLVLTHHDPARSDAEVADLELRCRELFPSTIAAREGYVVPVTRRRRARFTEEKAA